MITLRSLLHFQKERGVEETDMRGESFLSESVLITTIIGSVTLLTGIAGLLGGVEAYNGKSHFPNAIPGLSWPLESRIDVHWPSIHIDGYGSKLSES